VGVKKPKALKDRADERRAAFILLMPAFVGLIFLTYLPLLAVFALSFFEMRAGGTATFIGLQNYIHLFTADPFFMDSIRATVYFTFLAVGGSMIYSLVTAMLLNRKIPARGFFRAVFFLPYMLPAVAVYMGWDWLYRTDNFGLFNYVLNSWFGISNIMFLAHESWVRPSLALISVWLCGNMIVIFMAGLQNVPRVYHEAAEIDGANAWQRFWKITIPCMSPIIFYNLLMSVIFNLQIVTPALALTQGTPGNATRFITFLMYDYAFRRGHLGLASAVAFILFILIGIFTAVLFLTSKTWVFYEGDRKRAQYKAA
jgi:multiple sugar transport system permease protein